MTTEPDVDRRPLAVQQAADQSWRLGIAAAASIVEALLRNRRALLHAGFPSGHSLCEEIDRDAAKWAGRRDQMERDWRIDMHLPPNERLGTL